MGEDVPTNTLILHAPMSGPIVPLENVPDPVFAQKLVGDGISIDPTTTRLCAPCTATVQHIHRAKHAITLKTPQGVEILIHIGIDTVSLKGVGFYCHVQEGDDVQTGEELLSFDADFVATKAVSLLTQVLITQGEHVTQTHYGSGYANAGETALLTLTLNHNDSELAPKEQVTPESETQQGPLFYIPNKQGLHARPSATLVNCAKTFTAHIALNKSESNPLKTANAKSVVGLMGLELEQSDAVYFTASGHDATAAIAALTELAQAGSGENCDPIHLPESSLQTQSPQQTTQQTPLITEPANTGEAALPKDGILKGVSASPGRAVGQAWQLAQPSLDVTKQGQDSQTENLALKNALKKADDALAHLSDHASNTEQRAIFAAHRELLNDPALTEQAQTDIQKGLSAAWSWQQAYTTQANTLANLKSTLLAARATDMKDVGMRVLRILCGQPETEADLPDNTILIADDLTPSDTAQLDTKRVKGFCTTTGGTSSHVAIIARSMNIPAIAGADPRVLSIANGTPVLFNATQGIIHLQPKEDTINALMKEQAEEEKRDALALKTATQAAHLQSGEQIEVVTNLGKVGDADGAAALGAEGVGLLRSEFLFMDRHQAPTEDEQFAAYQQVANAFTPNQKVIIRTLDVGGDKPLEYLPIAKEENPFLGLRGIRVSLRHEAVFRAQLRAILRANTQGNIHIMFPMITTLDDLHQAKMLLEEERQALNAKPLKIGIMVEVPSVALLAEQFAAEVDFFSIGTNDLTQYTLAIDRGHPELAKTADPLNPAVLALIAQTVRGAQKQNIWVGVCGSIASDPLAVPVLLGLGVTELSCSLPSVPRIKATVRNQSMQNCRVLAQKVLSASSADEVREILQAATE